MTVPHITQSTITLSQGCQMNRLNSRLDMIRNIPNTTMILRKLKSRVNTTIFCPAETKHAITSIVRNAQRLGTASIITPSISTAANPRGQTFDTSLVNTPPNPSGMVRPSTCDNNCIIYPPSAPSPIRWKPYFFSGIDIKTHEFF